MKRLLNKRGVFNGQLLANWMMRDQIFRKEIRSEAKIRNYRTILVDGSISIDENYKKVKDYFKI